MDDQDAQCMRLALQEAEKGLQEGNYPAGAVIVRGGEVVGKGYSEVLSEGDPTAHGEMLAIRSAARRTQSRFLNGCTIYTTVEPCLMCAQALLTARIRRVVYGTDHKEYGDVRTFAILKEHRLAPGVDVAGGILRDEADKLMKKFFQKSARV